MLTTMIYFTNHGLRGRVLVVIRDKHGNTIGMTNELHCIYYSWWWPGFFHSVLRQEHIFYLRFPRSVFRQAVGMDIYQSNGGSLGNVLQKDSPSSQCCCSFVSERSVPLIVFHLATLHNKQSGSGNCRNCGYRKEHEEIRCKKIENR